MMTATTASARRPSMSARYACASGEAARPDAAPSPLRARDQMSGEGNLTGPGNEQLPVEAVLEHVFEFFFDRVDLFGQKTDGLGIKGILDDHEAIPIVLVGLFLRDQTERPLTILPGNGGL